MTGSYRAPGGEAGDSTQYFRPDDLPGVEAQHASYATHHRYRPHLHQAWSVSLIDDGSATIDVEGACYTAPAGTVVLVPPDVIHSGGPTGRKGYRYRTLYLDITAKSGWLPEWLHSVPRHTSPVVVRHAELAAALSRLHDRLTLPGRKLERGEILAAAIGTIAALLEDRRLSGRNPPPAGVARALEYIWTHWQEDFSLCDLAKAASVSQFHLSRIFRRHTGVSPSAYRRALRVRAAQRLLHDGWPPAMAAARCGFYDQAHLNRHFKAITGVTPRQYSLCQC